MNVTEGIFRAYDIRGVVDDTLTVEGVYDIGRAIGSTVQNHGTRKIVVARDGRLSGPKLFDALIRGLMAVGCTVYDIGPAPSPMMYFATHHLGVSSGVVLTGSHNPSNYNGLKIIIDGKALYGPDIKSLYRLIEINNLRVGKGKVIETDIVEDYVTSIIKNSKVKPGLRVVVDAGNGVTGAVAPELYRALGCEVIPLFCEVDGRFPNHHPDPGKPENLRDLAAAVEKHQADIGFAFDGDGDRLGVVDNNGKMIWPDRMLILLAQDILKREPGAEIIYDVKCTRHVYNEVKKAGGKPTMWMTGHSLIKAKMRETGALLAGEMSGHIFIKERWYGFDDALYTGARLLELLSKHIETAAELFHTIPESVVTPEIQIPVDDAEKFVLMEKLIAAFQLDGVRVSTIDGLRVDFADSWGLVRPSNTTPNLVLRFEADDEANLEVVKKLFRELFHKVAPELSLPF